MRNKIIILAFLFSVLIPTNLIFATYFTTSVKPATKYIGRSWTPLKPITYNFTNLYASLGSQFNPVYSRSYGTSGFINPYAKIGTQFNPVFIKPFGTSGFSNSYAPLGTQFNPINIR